MFDETACNDQPPRKSRTWKILGKVDMISKYFQTNNVHVLHAE
jgi:hypothetical protein